MVPQGLAAVHVTFGDDARAKAFGLYGTVRSVGSVAGPVLGSVLTEADLFLGLLLVALSLFNGRQFSGGLAARRVLGLPGPAPTRPPKVTQLCERPS
ncbi:hypothetical protein [Streptomyces noursei]|uniref:hypothetical protein n=1 Tax=Streptomyces noursei TaxID=1971 RepID=UPI0023B85841|nr:hypothetical protein [Streptomyces noursei]